MPPIDIRKTATADVLFYTPSSGVVIDTEVARLRGITTAGRAFAGRSGEFCRMVRAIIARTLRGAAVEKGTLMAEFGFPGRMVNTAVTLAEGQLASARECAILDLEGLESAIGRKLAGYMDAASDPARQGELVGRERHLTRLVHREHDAQRRVVKPSIFHGRDSYRHQTRKHWKRAYVRRRSASIGCKGSSDETAGNSTLQVALGPVERAGSRDWQWFTLTHSRNELGRFKLPASECQNLVQAVRANSGMRRTEMVAIWVDEQGRKIPPQRQREMEQNGQTPAALKSVPRVIKQGRVALTVMLRRTDEGKWNVHVSYQRHNLPAPREPNGWMGVDLNADSVAHAVLRMHEGQPVLGGNRKDGFPQSGPKSQRRERLYAIVNHLVEEARTNGLGIVLEYLDFEHCKRWLKTKLGALLHVFPYRTIRRIFERRCLEAGVPLRYVKPEYSSLLGAVLSRKWPQLGRDQAAAAVLALRTSEAGNRWLEGECERTALAEKVSLRLNAKGRFGHTTAVCWIRPLARQKDSAIRIHAPAPSRWQRSCGRQIKAALSTLSAIHAGIARELRRGTAPQKATPPFKMPRILPVVLAPSGLRSTLSMQV